MNVACITEIVLQPHLTFDNTQAREKQKRKKTGEKDIEWSKYQRTKGALRHCGCSHCKASPLLLNA